MTIGKAADRKADVPDAEFSFVAPCLDHLDEVAIRSHLAEDRFFWLDIAGPEEEDIRSLERIFGFHPLAMEDTAKFAQRPKLDDYGDYAFLVFYGCWHEAPDDAGPLRISDLIDSYRDLLSGATDLYLSTISNRQNDVMRQLTIIATVFLPLSFLTGFFGMNFSLLTGHFITTTWSFWVLGVGSMAATCVGLGWFFHRRGWL